MRRNRWLAGIFAVSITVSVAQVAEAPEKLPIVKSGEMPLYPPLLRLGQIEGEVRLRVTTDGSGVSSVTVESGHALLAKAALENVRTWKFEPHTPTVFSTLFSYRLIKELFTSSCDPDLPDNGSVVLKLPTQVEITSHLTMHDCHHPNEGLDLSEPLRVFLTACEIDGSPVPCERITIQLYSGNLVVTATRFKESKREGFVVPKEFRTLKKFGVNVKTGSGTASLAEIDSAFLKGDWHVGIDHAPFKEETPIYNAPVTVRCAAFIRFEWGEPEVIASAPCN
jgi:TonB family protein